MAKTVFALAFTIIVSASIPSPVLAAAKAGSKPIPVTLGGFSLTPTIGGYLFAGSEQRDATQSYGLKVGYERTGKSVADSLGIEGTLNYFTTTSKSDASGDIAYLFRLDAIYPIILGGKWMPFLAVGAGGIVIDSVSHADKSPLFNYGAGLKYFLQDYLAVRVDARHLLVYNNVNTRNNFEVGIGMSYYFGKERKKKPAPPPAIKQEETKDAKNGKKTVGTATKSTSGIPVLEEIATTTGEKAGEEKKPAVKGETPAVPTSSPSLVPSIDLAPLPAPESAVMPLFQAEAPKEGIGEKPVVRVVSPTKVEAVSTPVLPDKGATAAEGFEATSQNAATALRPGVKAKTEESDAAMRVEKKTVTPVIEAPPVATTKTPSPAATVPSTVNAEERKPEPAPELPVTAAKTQPAPAPAKAEEPLRQVVGKKAVRKLTVEFDINSSFTKPKYNKKLKELADILKNSADASARIEGHADSTGKLSCNIKLSIQRAQSVRSSLIKLGVDPGRISTAGCGPSRPIADNATTEGRQKNRRSDTSITLTVYE